MKKCFFIGHRECPDELYLEMLQAIERCISEFDVREFIVGRYGKFDHLAAKCVKEVKKKYPHIALTMLLPYLPVERRIDTPKGFDGSLHPEGLESVPKRLAIVRANRYAVDHADVLIAYVWHTASNARNLLEYAEKKAERSGLQMIRIGSGGQNEKHAANQS